MKNYPRVSLGLTVGAGISVSIPPAGPQNKDRMGSLRGRGRGELEAYSGQKKTI